MSHKFYIPIASKNLPHYLVSGIIVPAKYIDNRNPDIQDYNKDSILLSSFKFTEQSNCAIEIVLNQKEESIEKISENFYLFNMPLPISRIKSIYFQKNEQKVQTLFNIQSGIAFLPENLVKISDEIEISSLELDGIKSIQTKIDYQVLIEKFDKLMGGISVMNTAREVYQNYSTHFVATLGNINAHFNVLLKNQGIQISNQFEFAFNEDGKFRDLYQTIFSETNLEIVQTFARKEGLNIETKNGVIQLDKIPEGKQTYYVAILENFGAGKRKQLDSFISELISGNLDEKRKEGIALIFGLNKGYKAFRNKYKTANFEVDVKFHLDSQLDYYVIESIFQYVFNKKNNVSSFSYIDNWCNKASQAKLNFSDYKTYKILDTRMIYKKKLDFFEDYYQSFSQARNKVFSAIAEKIKSILPGFMSLDIEKATAYFDLQLSKPLKDFATDIISSMQETIDSQENSINNLESSLQEKNKETEVLKNEISELKQKNAELPNLITIRGNTNTSNKETEYDSNSGDENIINEPSNDDFEQIKSVNPEIAYSEKSLDGSNSSNDFDLNISADSKEIKNEDDLQESSIDDSQKNDINNNEMHKEFESKGKLFYDEMDRQRELMKLSKEKLETMASNLNLKIPSKKPKKEDIVLEILKTEFK